MNGLEALEQAVLDALLAGDHPVLALLRQQADRARLTQRRFTGVGFFCDVAVPASEPTAPRDCVLADVHAELEGLANGAGFALFIRRGRIQMLEGFTYDEPWPDTIRGFSLSYLEPSRRAELAQLD